MNIIPSSQTNKIHASPTTTIWEFVMKEKAISGAIAEIKVRYPENGITVNKVSKELAFVVAGHGHIVTPSQKSPVHIGDLIFLDKEESFAWEGNLTIFMATTPKFDSRQHIIITDNE